MTTLDTLLEPLSYSPQLPQAIALLSQQIEAERAARQRFYDEMTPEQKIEFIEGKVSLHLPARNRHLDVTLWVARLLQTYVEINDLGSVKTEKCLVVFPRNDYEPDIVFFGNERASRLEDDTLKFPVPDLVVEVLSETTEDRDRGVKFEDYAANGVGEYWIVDAFANQIEQYLLREGAYELNVKATSGRLVSRVIEGVEAQIEDFFDRDRNLDALRKLMGP